MTVTARGAMPETEAPHVPHSRPLLGRREEEAAVRVLRSGRLAPGPEADRAGALLARLTGCAGAVLLSSGTTALQLALRALGAGGRDHVAIPSYACAALLHAVRAAGARPLLCDIDPGTLALDPEDLARRASGAATFAVVVHPFGLAVPLEPFRSRGLKVVEDCAQALGAADRGRPAGARGDAAICSLGPTKVITCGGPGGALFSSSPTLVREVRDLARHDENEDDRLRLNALMGDLPSAIAAVQMERLSEFRRRRAIIARHYDEAFAPLGLIRPRGPEGSEPIVYRYLVRVPEAGSLLEALNRRGIGARRPVFRPLHLITGDGGPFPRTEEAHRSLVSLPIHPGLTDEERGRVVAEVRRCLS